MVVSVCASVLACTTPDIEGSPLRQRVVAETPSSNEEPPPDAGSSKEDEPPPKKSKTDAGSLPCKVDNDEDDCGSDRKKLECENASAMAAALKADPRCVKEEPDESDDYDLCCPT